MRARGAKAIVIVCMMLAILFGCSSESVGESTSNYNSSSKQISSSSIDSRSQTGNVQTGTNQSVKSLKQDEVLSLLQGQWNGTKRIEYDNNISVAQKDSTRGPAGTTYANNELGVVSQANPCTTTIVGSTIFDSFEKSWTGLQDNENVSHEITCISANTLSGISDNGMAFTQNPKDSADNELTVPHSGNDLSSMPYKDTVYVITVAQLPTDLTMPNGKTGTLAKDEWYLLEKKTGGYRLCWYRKFDLGSKIQTPGGLPYDVKENNIVKYYWER